MSTRSRPPGKRRGLQKDLLRRLSAGLSKEEIGEVLSGALASLDRPGLRRLRARLGPETGAVLERAILAKSGKSVKPGIAKVREEWKRAWREWSDAILEAGDEKGRYVLQGHHWEQPYFDPDSLSDDLDATAAKMTPLVARIFEENLDRGFGFAKTVFDSLDEVSSSLPDWMGAFEDGFALGPKATACLLDWESREARRDRKTSFEMLDSLRELEYSSAGVSLDENTLRGFVKRMGPQEKLSIAEGLRHGREEPRWKAVLGSSGSVWSKLYQELCRSAAKIGRPRVTPRRPR